MNRQLLTHADQLQDRARHDLTAVGRQRVETLDVRVAAIGRELPIHFGEDAFHFGLHRFHSGPGGMSDVLNGIVTAHGRAVEAFQGVAVAATRQHAGQHHKPNPSSS